MKEEGGRWEEERKMGDFVFTKSTTVEPLIKDPPRKGQPLIKYTS